MNEAHGYGETSDCLCGRNFATVRGLREHLTKSGRVFVQVCQFCGGPDDHGRDCLPASQGGTQKDVDK